MFTNSPANSDTSAVQEEENLFSNVQSQMQDAIPENNLFIHPISTQDSMTTDNFSRNSKNINNDSNCEYSSKLSNSSTSHRTYERTTFKEQLHDKKGDFVSVKPIFAFSDSNFSTMFITEKTLSLFKTKLDRTVVIVEEVFGKLDILNMNMN